MNTLTIVFLGLVALAPMDAMRKEFGVLVVDGTKPGDDLGFCTDLLWDNPLEAHKAALLVEKASVETGSSCSLKQVSSYPAFWSVELYKHEITLDTGKTGSGMISEITGVRGKGPTGALNTFPLKTAEIPDTSWLAAMRYVQSGMASVRRSCLDETDPWKPTSGGDPCNLSARLRITDGELATECITPRPACTPEKFQTFQFTEDGTNAYGVPSSLAEGTKLTINEVPATKTVEVLLTTFDGKSSCTVKLKAGRNHQIFIVNQVYFAPVKCIYAGSGHYEAFQAYYKLSVPPGGSVPCPVPYEFCGVAGSPRCPLVELDP